MKTVFICYSWEASIVLKCEDKSTCAVFEEEVDAFCFCQDAQHESGDTYLYNYKEWEVR